jgi:hypothetical protein
MDLSIVIVSWNVRDLLAACLQSIINHSDDLDLEVIVVDSASSDGSAALVRDQFPWVKLIAATENIGFTRGNNRALSVIQGRHVLLLNPDTVVHSGALKGLMEYLDTHPQVGIVGPQVLNADGSTQSTRRRFPTRITALFESTWLQGLAPREVLDQFYMADQPDDGTFEVDWVQGCALMARRAVYDQIGGLDEGYVMFSEELDWCKRANAAEWRAAYVGSAKITHYGGKSTEQVQANKHIYFQRSKIRYFRKFHGPKFALALWLFLLFSYLSQIMIESLKALLGSKRDLRQARIHTYRQVIRALAGAYRND